MIRSPFTTGAAFAVAAVCALTLAVGGAAHAQSAQSAAGGQRGFASCADYDLDGDGAVSESELRSARDERYVDADAATQAELYGSGSPDLLLAMFDTDGDGWVSRAEYVDGPSTCTR